MREHGSTQVIVFWVIGLVLVGLCTCQQAYGADPKGPPAITLEAHFLADFGTGLGAGGDSKYLFSAMYYADYANDGGVGVIGIGDDTADGDQSVIVGPGVEFPTGPVFTAALATVLPDRWAALFGDVMETVRPYARAGGLFDEDCRDVSSLLGSSLHIRPNSHVQIIPRADWINPQGRAVDIVPAQGWLFSVNAGFAF